MQYSYEYPSTDYKVKTKMTETEFLLFVNRTNIAGINVARTITTTTATAAIRNVR